MTAPALPPIRLTELTECGGCAAKLGADVLEEALAGLGLDGTPGATARAAREQEALGLIAGLYPPDDAAVHLVAPELAVIATLDFFPPLVDDPRTYGEIAAANALSDVFAMGGRVLFALSIAAIPEDMPTSAFREILDGASSKVREAGGLLAGGHTIRDPEPKYGLAVIGVAHPDRLLRKGGAKPDDVLLLTKRLAAAEVFVEAGVRGATDVTGFGLLGHGLEMARASGTWFLFDADALPALDGALDLARADVETTGAGHNRRYVLPSLALGLDVPKELVVLAHDPQTSGGLLAAVAPDALDRVRRDLGAADVEHWLIGRVEATDTPGIALT
jgi:selenide, water dikinase